MMENEATTTSDELDKIGHILFHDDYLGTFPADKYIEPTRNGQSCIINTQSSTGKGEHWISLINECDCIYVFDTYNRRVEDLNPHFSHTNWIQINHERFQSLRSRNCGQECMAFICTVRQFGVEAFFNAYSQ